jgi:hypothetical protein
VYARILVTGAAGLGRKRTVTISKPYAVIGQAR